MCAGSSSVCRNSNQSTSLWGKVESWVEPNLARRSVGEWRFNWCGQWEHVMPLFELKMLRQMSHNNTVNPLGINSRYITQCMSKIDEHASEWCFTKILFDLTPISATVLTALQLCQEDAAKKVLPKQTTWKKRSARSKWDKIFIFYGHTCRTVWSQLFVHTPSWFLPNIFYTKTEIQRWKKKPKTVLFSSDTLFFCLPFNTNKQHTDHKKPYTVKKTAIKEGHSGPRLI